MHILVGDDSAIACKLLPSSKLILMRREKEEKDNEAEAEEVKGLTSLVAFASRIVGIFKLLPYSCNVFI